MLIKNPEEKITKSYFKILFSLLFSVVSPLFIEADDRVSAKMIGLTSVIILVFFILVMVAFDLNLIISQLKEMVITVYTFVFRRND